MKGDFFPFFSISIPFLLLDQQMLFVPFSNLYQNEAAHEYITNHHYTYIHEEMEKHSKTTKSSSQSRLR
jgi:hypothetical protein